MSDGETSLRLPWLVRVLLLFSVILVALFFIYGFAFTVALREHGAEDWVNHLESVVDTYRTQGGSYPPGDGVGSKELADALIRKRV